MTVKTIPSPMDVAREAWGDELPDWVAALASECALTSQSKVAARLDRSAAVISQVLRRSYGAAMDRIEERVRGVLMNSSVACPGLGQIPMQSCQDWRAKAGTFAVGNPTRLRMYHACNRCPRMKKDGEE